MPNDYVTLNALCGELNASLAGGKIDKIYMPEEDEITLAVRSGGVNRVLAISANAQNPRVHFTCRKKQNPVNAPSFCMLLRKHIQNGRIVDISQPGLERIVCFTVEHLDELGDLRRKKLIAEIMGKHSNIIFCDEEDRIIDSIKHISGLVSSVREVLPGKPYFIPHTQDKLDPLTVSREVFWDRVFFRPMECYKALYTSFTGLSPAIAHEICYRAGGAADLATAACSDRDREALWRAFSSLMDDVRQGRFSPCISFENGVPAEYAAVTLTSWPEASLKHFDRISPLLEAYYTQKNRITRIRQRSSDLRRIVSTALERNVRKYDLQQKQLKDTQKRDQYRIYGELLNTYGYSAAPGAKSLKAVNYYTGEEVTIPLDPQLTATENAKRYFEKYNKLKRTFEALSVLTKEVQEEILHLQSVGNALDIAQKEEDLVQIKEELIQSGYIRRRAGTKKVKITSRPFHYISSDGFHMYVGKNNLQNEELTFHFASGSDWWFHAKGMPGSHVIVKSGGAPLPDRTFEEAARLAAHYSTAKDQEKAEVDYVEKKQVKKVAGAKPGFVIYHTNYSMLISTDISGILQVQD